MMIERKERFICLFGVRCHPLVTRQIIIIRYLIKLYMHYIINSYSNSNSYIRVTRTFYIRKIISNFRKQRLITLYFHCTLLYNSLNIKIIKFRLTMIFNYQCDLSSQLHHYSLDNRCFILYQLYPCEFRRLL